MLLEYCHNTGLNFGDDLNKWLWPRLVPECLDPEDGWVFLGIGTVLTHRRNDRLLRRAKGIVVLSSGSWGDDSCPVPDSRWHVYGVRGPETARRLGLGADKVVGDGAYLLARQGFSRMDGRGVTGFIPHHRSEDYIDWRRVCRLAGYTFISARQPVEAFMADVAACESVVTEAMHGAIAADVLRIPWRAVSYAPNFRSDKWNDWGASMGIVPCFHALPPVYDTMVSLGRAFENRVKRAYARAFMSSHKWSTLPVARGSASDDEVTRLAEVLSGLKSAPAQLTDDVMHQRTVERLEAAVDNMRKDFRAGVLG